MSAANAVNIDAVVIGGGPAGSAAARLLTTWGHDVVVLTTTPDRSRGLAESLPPSTQRVLAEVGVLDAVDAAGFYRSTGNTSCWASRERRVETFGSLGYQIFRPDFDRLLLDRAAAAGADVREGTRVGAVHVADDGVRVDYTLNGRPSSTSAQLVIDCSGRAGVVARRLREYEPAYRTYAIVGVWRSDDGWELSDETHTVVETFEHGWAWSVPVDRSTRHVGAMVDGTSPRAATGRELEAAYRGEIAKTVEMRRLLGGAGLLRVFACDASLYSSRAYAGPRFLLAGDAASFIDPLSSFGVKKALASAWMAAVTAHTCLLHPDRRPVAVDFFSNWERQVYAASLRHSRDFARQASERHPHPFWAARAGVDVPLQDDIDAPDVRAAFERIKGASSIVFRLADDVRLEKAAVIRDHEIVVEDAFPGIRFFENVDLVKLAHIACQHTRVPDVFDAYCRAQSPAPLPSVIAGLCHLVTKGILQARA